LHGGRSVEVIEQFLPWTGNLAILGTEDSRRETELRDLIWC
jgi:hypothetical protein